jgi:hypothetical protein
MDPDAARLHSGSGPVVRARSHDYGQAGGTPAPGGGAARTGALEKMGALPERTPVGHRSRGLQRQRGRLELLPPRPRALPRLPVGRRWPGRDLRRQAAVVFRDRLVERRGSDPQGTPVRLDQRRREPRRRCQRVLFLPGQHADALVHEIPVQIPANGLSLRGVGGNQPATLPFRGIPVWPLAVPPRPKSMAQPQPHAPREGRPTTGQGSPRRVRRGSDTGANRGN